MKSLLRLMATTILVNMTVGLPTSIAQTTPAPAATQASQNNQSPEDALPPYPQVSLAPSYEVDPGWPKKPADFVWEAMPGIAVDQHDQVWIFTRSDPPVQVYRPDGTYVKSWGGRDIGNAHHLKIDPDGNVWVADIGLHVIRKFSPDGEVLQTIGTPGIAGDDAHHLNKPTDMVLASDGHVFVSDGYGNNRVVHFDDQGRFVAAWGQLGVGPNDLSLPHAIAMDSTERIYVADRNNVRVQIYDRNGTLLDSWSNVIVPWGFWVTADDEIWVCGSSPMPWQEHPDYPGAPLSCPPRDQIVMKFAPSGRALQLWSIPKGIDGHEQPGDVNWLHAMAVDSHGNLYLGDIIGKRAQKFALQNRTITTP